MEKPEIIRELDEKRDGRRVYLFRCKYGNCNGNEFKSILKSIRNGSVKSCGCSRKTSCQIHGGKYTSEYTVWCSMKDRCYNAKNKTYKYYGGRGVYVCNEWLNNFAQFKKDMGTRPYKNHSIHRQNDSLCYCKESCVWATKKVQSREQRTNRIIEFKGEKKTLAEWSEVTGISRMLISGRLDRLGWTIEEALTTPVRANKRQKINDGNNQKDQTL